MLPSLLLSVAPSLLKHRCKLTTHTRYSSSLKEMASRKDTASSALQTLLDPLVGVESTDTKAGWCLREGIEHIYGADDGMLASLIDCHGLPTFYSCLSNPTACRHEKQTDQKKKNPSTCFESLCRTITGQSVSGYAAQAVWKRLLETVSPLTPERVLELVPSLDNESQVVASLQKPAGLSRAKARSVVDLACHFRDGKLSEELLTQNQDDKQIRSALMQVKGLGPWSCDIFLIFYLERPNILPLGDLGVRKGIAKHFDIRGSLKKGMICHKKDAKLVQDRLRDYQPYSSLLSYYMWRVADTPLNIDDLTSRSGKSEGKTKKDTKMVSKTKRPRVTVPEEHPTTPSPRAVRRRRVTP